MSSGLRVILLLFAAIGYGGAGASLAVARYRGLADGVRDVGMRVVAALLLLFAAFCTIVSAGVLGVPAFGGVVMWASYLFMAQRLGLFRIETEGPPSAEEEHSEEPRRAK